MPYTMDMVQEQVIFLSLYISVFDRHFLFPWKCFSNSITIVRGDAIFQQI